jgi:hypothetical protein
MQSKSETKNVVYPYPYPSLYEVNIDFDDASASWKQNKKNIGNGMYKYICPCITKKGAKCGKATWKDEDNCYIHKTNKMKHC